MSTETWLLSTKVSIPSTNASGNYGGATVFNAKFVSNGLTYSKITLMPNIMYSPYGTMSYDGKTVYKIESGFYNTNYRQITFLDSSTMPTALRTWLQSNGIKTTDFTGEIFQDKKTATILKTKNKYCDVDIYIYPILQEKSVTPTTTSQSIIADDGYVGLSKITVNAVPTETKTVTAGTSTTTVAPTSGKFLTSVTVNPTPSEERLAIPKANAQVVTPNSGKLLSSVTVDAVPTEEKTVTAGTNTTTVTPTSGKFFTSVTVNPTPSEEKTVEITSSGNTVITPSSGKLLSKVTVSPMLESYSVAAEATEKVVTPTDGYAGLSSVTIAAAPLQDITVTQATDIAQEITNPDPGYYGFGKITVPQLTGEEKTVTITENGTTTVNYSDPKLMSKVTITTNVPSVIDVATAAGMNAVLVAGNVGRVYRFTGTTDSTYTNGDLYEVVSG